MKKKFKLILILISFLALVFLSYVTYDFIKLTRGLAAMAGPCGNKEIQRAYSKDGKWVAIAFYKDCGELGAPSYISIKKRSWLCSDEIEDGEIGNVFRCAGVSVREIQWLDDKTLVLPCYSWANTKSEYKGIKIIYKRKQLKH